MLLEVIVVWSDEALGPEVCPVGIVQDDNVWSLAGDQFSQKLAPEVAGVGAVVHRDARLGGDKGREPIQMIDKPGIGLYHRSGTEYRLLDFDFDFDYLLSLDYRLLLHLDGNYSSRLP